MNKEEAAAILSARWQRMTIEEQISNIGSEVHRVIRYKNKNDKQKASHFCNKAVEFLEYAKADTKNVHRQDELNEAIIELKDYFQGDNIYGTTDDVLTRYYDAFLYRI